jgi:hypothetical protein
MLTACGTKRHYLLGARSLRDIEATLQSLTRKAKEDQLRNDWAEVKRYRDDDAKIGPPAKGENRVVFMGDSITSGWIRRAPEFFKSKSYFDHGGGQTRPQMLVPCTKPAGRIAEMNMWIKAYAAKHGLVYLNYDSAMVDDHGGTKRDSPAMRPP